MPCHSDQLECCQVLGQHHGGHSCLLLPANGVVLNATAPESLPYTPSTTSLALLCPHIRHSGQRGLRYKSLPLQTGMLLIVINLWRQQ